jgi:glycosyltransferase involved in cell wall biosynthesis
MRIANIMLSNAHGGLEQVYLDYCRCLLARGNEVLAIFHANSAAAKSTQAIDCDRLHLCGIRAKGGVAAIYSMAKIRLACKRFLPDAIIVHNYLHLCLTAVRGIAPTLSVSHMYKFKHLSKLNGFVALTREIEQLCIAKGFDQQKIFRIPNMIEGPFTKPQLREQQSINFGALGRLALEKGFHVLLEACGILISRGLDFHCYIGGAGYQEDELQESIRRLNLSGVVELVGFVDDKASFFERLDVFVLSSLSETFGLTLLEAMKYGVPIVSTRSGGPNELLKDEENAIMVPLNDAQVLADAMYELAQSPTLRNKIAVNNYQLVSQTYSSEVVGGQLEAVLDTIRDR